MFPEFTINSVDFSRIYFEFTIECANSLWNSLVFWLYTLNSLLNHLILHEFAMNLLVVWRFTMNLPSFSRINYEYTLFFANSSCFDSLSIADSVRIPSVLRESTLNSFSVSRIRWLFRENNMNWLSVFRWIHCLFRESTMYLLSISRIYYEFTIYFPKSPRIHFPFREFIMDSLFYFANSLFFCQNVFIVFACFTRIKCLFPHYVHIM